MSGLLSQINALRATQQVFCRVAIQELLVMKDVLHVAVP